MPTKILVPVIIGAVVGLAMLGVGLWARSSAPEGANANTALYVTGGVAAVLVLLAVLTAVMRAARTLVTVSALVCLVAAGAVSGRLYPALKNQERFTKAAARWKEAVETGKRPDNAANREAFFKGETDLAGTGDHQTHDKQYLINALMAATGIAVAGTLLLFATRPKAD